MPHVGNWKARERIEQETREWAFGRWTELRDFLREQLLGEVLSRRPEAEWPDYRRHFPKWLATWEVPERSITRRVVTALDPKVKMTELMSVRDRLKTDLDQAMDNYEGSADDERAALVSANAIVGLYRAFADADARLSVYVSGLDVQDQWMEDKQHWTDEKRKAFKLLYADYEGKGEVYRQLCERASALYVGLMRMEQLGRVEGADYQKLSELHRDTLAQIQKHTESLKTENLDVHIQEIGEQYMHVLERVLSNQADLLQIIQVEIGKAIIEGEIGTSDLRLIQGGKS